jgi:hypothetical protein
MREGLARSRIGVIADIGFGDQIAERVIGDVFAPVIVDIGTTNNRTNQITS